MNAFKIMARNRGFFWFSFCLFIIGLLIGLVFFQQLHEKMQPLLQNIGQIAAGAKGNHLNLSLALLSNNVKASLVLIVSGIFLAILAIGGIVVNGIMVGYAVSMVGQTAAVPAWSLVVFGLLPHGVFEIPAFLLAGSMGIKLGYMWLRPMTGFTRWQSFRRAVGETLYLFPVILLLLVVAAGVEGFVTPKLLSWYVKS
ncbi:stage II sporulation protein M [Effusibacillus dendaii]|uniref:Sporulation protein n=1 Tax=Effusibacillus dendaii TaxID=2743772 RepID=A0A7I8DB20_9BACL|nr:stage II sporulation protein M [Effusibacillus dendaii]BCJ87295.1 sporulation protein [Effusibacillus dendaii]